MTHQAVSAQPLGNTGAFVRSAGPDEAPTLLRIIHASFLEYVGAIDPPSSAPDETVDRINGYLQKGSALVAEVEGSPVGCVFFQVSEDHVYLYRLAVLPGFRGRGIGKALVHVVENHARVSKLPVRLGVRLALPLNLAMYYKLGYRTIEHRTHPGYPVPTFVIMQKDVSPSGG